MSTIKTNQKIKFFVGIDLGGKKKKTTGLCILEGQNKEIKFFKKYCQNCRNLKYSEIFKILKPYFKNIEVVAIDGPLTLGRGKGLLRLYEKFLLTKIFRKERITPIPPALMPELSFAGRDLVKKLKELGFALDKNLIETFPTLIRKVCPNLPKEIFGKNIKIPCKTPHQEDALICSLLAFLHFNLKTRWLGYKDGFLFLPEMSFWQKEWRQKFYQAWQEREHLKYHHLITNIFSK